MFTRYEIADEDGETRRERNDRVREYTPPFKVPDEGLYIWNWFRELNNVVSRQSEGWYRFIPPSEYHAWSKITGTVVYPWEYDILMAMDKIFCEETNKEITAIREKKQHERERELQQRNKKR